MKEIPILFSTPMVQAILAGRKSITRRTNGLDFVNESPETWSCEKEEREVAFFFFNKQEEDYMVEIKCPYGQPGDVLWVRETFMRMPREGFFNYKAHHPIFKYADDKIQLLKDFGLKWKPSIHMPKEAARIWLRVKNVRVERLQNISNEDAISEGVMGLGGTFIREHFKKYAEYYDEWEKNGKLNNERPPLGPHPIEKFAALWQSINGRESWDANPWVWVVEFEVLSTTGRPCSI